MKEKSMDIIGVKPEKAAATAEKLMAEMDEHLSYFTLVKGVNKRGNPSWAWVNIQPSKYEEFLNARKQPEFELAKYVREIWANGEGEPPSFEAIRGKIQGKNHTIQFGIKEEFEEEMRKAMSWAEKVASANKPLTHAEKHTEVKKSDRNNPKSTTIA